MQVPDNNGACALATGNFSSCSSGFVLVKKHGKQFISTQKMVCSIQGNIFHETLQHGSMHESEVTRNHKFHETIQCTRIRGDLRGVKFRQEKLRKRRRKNEDVEKWRRGPPAATS